MTTAARSSLAEDLTIEEIEVIPIRVPLPRRFQGSHYSMTSRCTIITRIHTRGGLVSEIYNGDTDVEQSIIVGIIRDEIAPRLIGLSALDTATCWEAMLPPTFDILRDRSLALQAIACVDSAIWDLVGKSLGVPLFKLWGGYRDTLPAICIGGYYGDGGEKEVVDQIEHYLELGFAGCKFKIGGASPSDDAHRVRLARATAGDDFILMTDANQGYTRRESIEFCRLTADVNLRWLEEPVGWRNDHLSLRDVRMITGVPITAGQSEDTRSGLRDLIASGAVDQCNADASWIGGPSEWLQVAAIASSYEVQMAHHEEPQVSAHLLSAIPHGTYVETFDETRDPIFWNLIANRNKFVDGQYAVPDGPGFGIEIDWDFANRYRTEADHA